MNRASVVTSFLWEFLEAPIFPCLQAQWRQLRRRNFDSETIFCLEGFNACHMGKSNLGSYSRSKHRIPISRGASKAYRSKFPYTAAQASVLQHVSSCVSSLGPPPEEMTASGAFDELRGSATSYDGLPASCCPVSYSPEMVSLPDCHNKPADLHSSWDFRQKHKSGDLLINSISKHKILPADFAAAKLQAAGDPKPYSDPLLRQTKHYSQFVRRLL